MEKVVGFLGAFVASWPCRRAGLTSRAARRPMDSSRPFKPGFTAVESPCRTAVHRRIERVPINGRGLNHGRNGLDRRTDQDIVELLSLYLTGSRTTSSLLGNGEDALEQLRQHPADIALVDIMMPRMNGYDFIKALRATNNIPVIIISARTQAADKIVGLDAGADGFIAKPFNPLEVTAQIRALLRRRATDVADALAAGPAAPPPPQMRRVLPRHRKARHPFRDQTPLVPVIKRDCREHPAPSTPSQDGRMCLAWATSPLTRNGSSSSKAARRFRSPPPSSRSWQPSWPPSS